MPDFNTLLQRITNWFAVPRQKSSDIGSPSGMTGFSLGYMPSNTGTPSTPYSSLQIAAVYACCRALSEDTARLPMEIKRRLSGGGAVVDRKHALNDLLRQPNAWMTSFEMVSFVTFSLALRGNAYVVIDRDGKGNPIRLIPIIPDRVVPLLTENGTIYYQVTHQVIGTRNVSLDSMMHFKNISLDGGILGTSPIALSQDSLGLAASTQKHAAIYFKQGTLATTVVKTEGTLSPERAQALARQWERAYSGNDNAGKAIILEGGTSVEKLSMSAVDAQLLESRKFSVEEIARIFNVPMSRIGAREKSSYASLESDNRAYIDLSLIPIIRKYEETMEAKLLWREERDDYMIRFNFDDLLRADMKTRFECYQIGLLNGFINADEVREAENMPPLPDKQGQEFRVPMNTTPIDAIKPGSTLASPTPVKPHGEQVE